MKHFICLLLLISTCSNIRAQFSVNGGIGSNIVVGEYWKLSGLGLQAGIEYEFHHRFSIISDIEYYFPNSRKFETIVRGNNINITPSFQDARGKDVLEMYQYSAGFKYSFFGSEKAEWKLRGITNVGFGYAHYKLTMDNSTYDSDNYQPDIADFDPAISGVDEVLKSIIVSAGLRIEKKMNNGLAIILESNIIYKRQATQIIIPGITVQPEERFRYPNTLRFAIKVKKEISFGKK